MLARDLSPPPPPHKESGPVRPWKSVIRHFAPVIIAPTVISPTTESYSEGTDWGFGLRLGLGLGLGLSFSLAFTTGAIIVGANVVVLIINVQTNLSWQICKLLINFLMHQVNALKFTLIEGRYCYPRFP